VELKGVFVQDEEGRILPGATCYLYIAGSNALATGLQDKNGGVVTQPFYADSNGLVQFRAPDREYDLRVISGTRDYRLRVQFIDVAVQVAAASAAATAAQAAAAAAQLAADQANAKGSIFPNTTAGLAATPVGGYFSVPSPSVTGFLDLYQNVAGVATYVKTSPSDELVKVLAELLKVVSGDNPNNAVTFLDENKFVLLKLLANGGLDMFTSQLLNWAQNGLLLTDSNGFTAVRLGLQESNINGLTLRNLQVPEVCVTDQNNFIMARADSKTAYFGPQTGNTAPALPAVAQLDQQERTDHKQVIEYGQSLSVGVKSRPALSLVQEYQNLMLASGVRVRAGATAYDPSAYVPLVEADDGGDQGETPVSAICNGITRRAIEAGDTAERWVMLGMSPGVSGAPVETLSPAPMGNGTFEKVVQQVRDCNTLSVSLGKTYSVWAYSWEQGESNYIPPATTNPYQYMQYQLALFDRLTEEVLSITKQKFRPYLFTYQVAAHRRYATGAMGIALAQWRISRQRPDVVVAAPCYMFPVAFDNLHLTNEASWLLGEYKSRAVYETMVRRAGKWRPLEPVSVDWEGTNIDIKFHVPRGKLVLDDALATMTYNYGFDIYEGATVPGIVSNVALVGRDTVRLTLSRAAANDAVLCYARGRPGDPSHSGPVTGARGNLRDTHGDYDTAESPSGIVYALHNACVMFQYDRQTGF